MLLDILQGHKESRHNMLENTQLINLIVAENGLIPIPGYSFLQKMANVGKIRGAKTIDSLKGIVFVIDEGLYLYSNSQVKTLVKTGIVGSEKAIIVENYDDYLAIATQGAVYEYSISKNQLNPINLGGRVIQSISEQDSRIAYLFKDDILKLSKPGETTIYEDFSAVIPGNVVAVENFVNQLWVFTKDSIFTYYDTGTIPNIYAKSSTISASFGCSSLYSVAKDFGVMCWLGSNKSSSLFIAITEGADPHPILDSDTDYLLSQVTDAENAIGSLYKMDGNTIYQLYFPKDGFGIIYNFYTKKVSKIVLRETIEFILPYDQGYVCTLENDATLYRYGFDQHYEKDNVIETALMPPMIDVGKKIAFSRVDVAIETGQYKKGFCELLISKDRGIRYFPFQTRDLPDYFGQFLRFYGMGAAWQWSFLFKFHVEGQYAIKRVEIT